ncbi:MAG: ribose ABC transporter permease [Bacilli bacterium]|nr:ribose ABC transporter permease [Bacilli bacterium]MDD4607896.1 ribose ABC transporter permease [Bacilli bacterium]
MLIVTLIDTTFIQPSNLTNVLRQVSINGLIALGMSLVILTGGIDLSVGSVFGLTSAILASMLMSGVNSVFALIVTLILGLLLGLVNGILISKGKLQAFIATLGTMTIYRGILQVFTDGRPITGFDSDFIDFIGRGYIVGIPFPTIILIIATLGVIFLTKKTAFGKEIYAVGGNEKTARLSAINVDKVKMKVYAISGLLASISGVILLSRLNSAQVTAGTAYEMDAIAAVVLGGTSMSGGKGKITGTFIGILLIGVLSNALNILNVSSFYQNIAKGIVILLAVLIDRKK